MTVTAISAVLGIARPQRPAVQLVKRVRGEADRKEERGQRRDQPVQPDLRREHGAEHHVGQVPCREGRMQQRPPVPQRPRTGRVVGRPGLRFSHLTWFPT